MNRLNQKIAEILKQHPEGEDFFDALDAMLRGDMDILTQFLTFAENKILSPEIKTLILTGQFGIALMNVCGDKLRKMFKDVILINGGIRTGAEPIIYREDLKSPNCVMFDDSFYSGSTRDKIQAKLKTIHSGASIGMTIVIYDGSLKVQHSVYSMFRYHSDKPLWQNDLANE